MRAFLYHFMVEFNAGLRNRTLLLMNYLLPLGFHMMMGLVMATINPLFLETMIPSMVLFAVLSGMVLGLPQPLVEARQAGIFRSYKINGVPSVNTVSIPALSTFVHVTITSVIITATGSFLFGAPLPQSIIAFVMVYVAVSAATGAIGVLIGVVSSSPRMTVLFSQLVYLPSMMISGMMFPSALLPETMARISRLLPATYAMDAFSVLGMGHEAVYAPVWSLLILVSTGGICFGLALYLFQWDSGSRASRPVVFALVSLLPAIVGMVLLPVGEQMELFSAWLELLL